MKKNLFAKGTFDTLDMAEYFCGNAKDKEVLWAFVGHNELKYALRNQSLNPAYSNRVAKIYGLSPVSFDIEQTDVQRFIDATSRLSDPVAAYLVKRDFPLELCKKYSVGGYCYNDFKDFDFGTMSRYYWFDRGRLEYLNYIIDRLDIKVDLFSLNFVVIPSYDHTGKINNLAFRVINEEMEGYVFKWLFAYGRQATFGLDKCDLSKPVTVVEGFFDYIACNESGIENVVGLGSAYFSEEHIKLLSVCKAGVNLLLDNDDTGKKYVAFKFPEGLVQGKVLKLHPDYKDPYDCWCETGKVIIL